MAVILALGALGAAVSMKSGRFDRGIARRLLAVVAMLSLAAALPLPVISPRLHFGQLFFILVPAVCLALVLSASKRVRWTGVATLLLSASAPFALHATACFLSDATPRCSLVIEQHHTFVTLALLAPALPAVALRRSLPPAWQFGAIAYLLIATGVGAAAGSVTGVIAGLLLVVAASVPALIGLARRVSTSQIAIAGTVAILATVAIAALAPSILGVENSVATRLPRLLETAAPVLLEGEDPEASSGGERAYLLTVGLNLVKEHPWSGIGIDNTRHYWTRLTEQFDQNSTGTHLHNQYLEVAASVGLPLFLAYVVGLAAVILFAYRTRDTDGGRISFTFVSFVMFIGLTNTTYKLLPMNTLLLSAIFVGASVSHRSRGAEANGDE